MNGGYVSSTDSLYSASTRTDHFTCLNVQPYRTQQVYTVCARPCHHFSCVHGRVNFFLFLYGRASFFSGTAVPRFFPVRPCILFHVRPCHRCVHTQDTQPSGVYTGVYIGVRCVHRCVHTHTRPVFIIISISYYKQVEHF